MSCSSLIRDDTVSTRDFRAFLPYFDQISRQRLFEIGDLYISKSS